MRRPLAWYSVANIGRWALIPPIVVGVLLPLGLLLAKSARSPQLGTLYVDYSARLIAPALAAWWAPLVFRERIEGDGRELLYLVRRKGTGATALTLALWYWILLVPFALLAWDVPGFSAGMLLILLGRCLFMTSLAFGAAFALNSSAFGLILALLFNMVAMTPLEELGGSPTLTLISGVRGGEVIWALLVYVVLSVALLLFGEGRSRCFTG